MNEVVLSILKVILAVLILPFLIACLVAFYFHLGGYPVKAGGSLLWGMFGALITFLFLHQAEAIYLTGRKIICGIFKFMAPVNLFLSHVIPFYFLAVMGAYYGATHWMGIKNHDTYFLGVAGFAFASHIFFVAQDLQQQERSLIKPTYLFSMCVIVILNLFIAVLLLDGVFQDLTFPKYFDRVWAVAMGNYKIFLNSIFMLGGK